MPVWTRAGSRADGVFLIGCGTDIVPIKPALEAVTALEVTASEEPDMALARGAALASANAPLFASSTAALAYALDPGTGEMNPRALSATYLDVCGNAALGSGALAYSAIEDDEGDQTRRGRRMSLLAGSALAAISAIVAGALVVSLTSDRPTSAVRRHNPRVSVATPAKQVPAQLPSPLPPAPSTEVAAAPPVPPPAEQPAPPTQVNRAPATPVHRAPPQRAPEYVPTPAQRAAPEPPPAAPPPPPPAAAPAPPPAAPAQPRLPPMTMYLHLPFVTVPIPINPPPPPPAPPPAP